MTFSFKFWQEVADLADKASEAREALDKRLIDELGNLSEDPKLRVKQQQTITNLWKVDGVPTQIRPVKEWTGGDSGDPKNYRWREGDACPLPRQYFTDEEAEAYFQKKKKER